MRKSIKRAFAAVLALAMTCASFTVPVFADDYTPLFDGDTVLNEWKFDFGSKDDVAEGYTAVTPDRNYITEKDYGFIGIDENAYKVSNRTDGFGNQEGQVINLQAGGGTGLYDGIGSVGEDLYGNAGDKYYPVRFALKVGDEKYFRIRATVTTLDPEKSANVTLYTERKHPIVKNKTLEGGEHYTVDFSIRTTPIYYEKSNPKGSIADEMVNVCVLGENSALAALEIQEVESFPTMWVLGDSTVTDGNTTLPYFDLHNYTGVGTGLTMYLPRNMAMVNEGEGGLAAGDIYHFNMVKDRIKAGDYMYVEYGHNQASTAQYKSQLDQYYNACHSVGAKLLIVSPCERINTFSDGAYQQTLNGYADTGEEYTAEKVAAGADDIAYVDLNDWSHKWYNEITTANGGDENAIKFYFRTAIGGGVDTTHPNDKGAEWLAYKFMQAAQAVTDETQKAVVQGFLTGMTTETPTLVSQDIIDGGLGGTAWPRYVVQNLPELPIVINDIAVGEDGSVEKAVVSVREAEKTFDAYGIIVITVFDENGTEKGKIYAVDQVDNSTGYGEQTIENFTDSVTIGATDTYTAVVMQAAVENETLVVDEEANNAYSAVYKPTDIEKYILPGEDDSDVETFKYYNCESLTDSGDWVFGGSAAGTFKLGTDDNGVTYSQIMSGGGNSWFLMRPLENLDGGTGYSGRYMVSCDMKIKSGSGLNFILAESTTPNKSPFVSDNNIKLFSIGANGAVTIDGESAGSISALDWTNITYIIDLDRATAEISVGGGTPVTTYLSCYDTTGVPTPATLAHFVLSGDRSAAFDFDMSNLVVAKLKDTKLPEYKVEVGTLESESEMGTAEIMPLPTPVPTPEPTVKPTEKPPVAAPTPTPAVTALPLHDAGGNLDDDKICSDYSVSVTSGEEYDTINVTAKNLKPYQYSTTVNSGYWIGVAIAAPAGTEIDAYNFVSTKDDCTKDLIQASEDEKQRVEFWLDSETSHWLYIELKDGRKFTYKVDTSNVKPVSTAAPAVTTAPLHDCSAENPVEDKLLYAISTYKVKASEGADDCDFEYEKLSLSAYDLQPHENAEHTLGYWVGAAVTAPEGTTIDGYYFSTAKYNGAFEQTAEDDKQTIEFYVNAADLYKVVWAAVKLSDDRIFVYRIDVMGVVQGGGDVTVEAAALHDCSAENAVADDDLYKNYMVKRNVCIGYTELIVTAAGLKKHENANHVQGYWVGAAITAPEGTTIDGYYFSADEYNADRTFTATGEDDKQTIEFYVDAKDENPKKWAAIKLNTGRVCVYKFNLTGVEVDGAENSSTDSDANSDNTDVQTMTALFDDNAAVTVAYEGNTVKLTATAGCKAVLLEAVYDENGFLTGLYPTTVVFDKAETKEYTVRSGCKVMVWDSLESAKPLAPIHTVAPAATVTPTPIPPVPTVTPTPTPIPTADTIVVTDTEESVVLNTVVTVKATPNEGYVFMGWKDKDGKLVSSEAEYAFRLRNDVKLYADFAKEPGVETIATFDIASDKTSVKIGTETVINLTVGNAKNSAGIPISKVTNADGEWSVDDSAITIANGVMTIPASYTTDEIKKVVTATCKINNVSKSVKIKLYNTEYYEDFTDISTISDWGLTDSSTSSLTGIVDTATSTDFAGMTAAGNGKVAVIGNGSSGTGKKLSYSKSFGVSDKSLLKFGFDIEPHRIRNDGKSATATLQFVDSDGTAVFTITVDTAGGNSSFNGTAVNGFKIGTVVSVDTVLDFTNKTISYTLTDTSGKELASGSGELTATNFDRMYFDGDWQYGKFAIDNVYMDCE